MTPLAGPGHQHVVGELYSALRASAVLSEDSPYVDPSDVLLVVEVESPSTKSTDRSLKRDRYAQWRIPSYWIVDTEARTVTRLRLGGQRLHEVGDPEGSWLSSVDVTAVWPR
ncbi:Uma2 family endonuclease [Kineococcus endophyticus]|uniref:Uma2 family endonuclease n=1 Tax=Kineococcus endophyticus TaxID=1181883 RepID=A0ABV3P7E3_9ACTN